MSALIFSQLHFLNALGARETSKQQVKELLKHLNRKQFRAISEICLNLIKGRIDITREEKDFLKKYSKSIRIIGSVTKAQQVRKQYISPSLVVSLLRICLPFVRKLFKDAENSG